MPANPKKISFATASTDTLFEWLVAEGVTPHLYGGHYDGYFAVGWLPERKQFKGKSPVDCLRKLCREVYEQRAMAEK